MQAIILPAGRPDTCHPLTVSTDLAACRVGNRSLREAQEACLREAGCELVDKAVAGVRTLFLAGNAWAHPVDLALLAKPGGAEVLHGAGGNLLACMSSTGKPTPEAPLQINSLRSAFITYPWHFLRLNQLLLDSLEESRNEGEIAEGVTTDGVLVVGSGSRLLPGVYVEGTVLIGANCKIGPNCYLRGPLTIGDEVHIGNAVEVKASIIGDRASIGHLSYVGDSIIGADSNVGAGTITANFRHDGGNHRSMVNGALVDTGRRKLGTITGEGVHTGIHTSIYPGRKLWPGAATRPGDIVQRDIDHSDLSS